MEYNFRQKFQAVPEKTANDFRELLFAGPGRSKVRVDPPEKKLTPRVPQYHQN